MLTVICFDVLFLPADRGWCEVHGGSPSCGSHCIRLLLTWVYHFILQLIVKCKSNARQHMPPTKCPAFVTFLAKIGNSSWQWILDWICLSGNSLCCSWNVWSNCLSVCLLVCLFVCACLSVCRLYICLCLSFGCWLVEYVHVSAAVVGLSVWLLTFYLCLQSWCLCVFFPYWIYWFTCMADKRNHWICNLYVHITKLLRVY